MKKRLFLTIGLALIPSLLLAQLIINPAQSAQIINQANNFLIGQLITLNGLASTDIPALTVQNTTASTVGTTEQHSPSLVLCGTAWNSSGAASETDCAKITIRPRTAAGTTSADLDVQFSIAGAAYGSAMRFKSFNALQATNISPQSSFTNGSGNRLVASGSAPTISSGFGSSPSIVASNGSWAFTVNVGTGGTASAGVIGMPTATTGWNCKVENRTGVAANVANQRTVQTATSTTTITVQNQTISTGAALAWTASDILAIGPCAAY